MDSTFSLVSNIDNLLSIDSSRHSKEYTYADQYPIFIDQQKFSMLITKSTSVNPSRSNNFMPSISRSPDSIKSQLPIVPESKHADKSKSLSDSFHFSKFPSSSLNVELEKQCILAELYQNIDKLKIKDKLFPPIKVVWNKKKAKSPKKTIKSSLMNMKAVINGETNNILCPNCTNTKCKCEVLDKVCEST